MLKYAVRRVPTAVVTLFIASVVVFMIIHLIPGDPAVVLAGSDASQEQVASIERDLGLDQPLPLQYWDWLSGVVTGDLGTSYVYNSGVSELILQRLSPTLELAVAAMLLTILMGFALGIWEAMSRRRVSRSAVSAIISVGLATPPFVSGILLVLILSVQFRVLPPGGHVSVFQDTLLGLRALVMPAFALALPFSMIVARILGSSVRQAQEEEYVQTAIAKGLASRQITFRHMLPNAIPPTVVILGIVLGHILGGAVIIETIFSRPGLGLLLAESVRNQDYVVVQALLLITIAIPIVIQVLTDMIQAALDPRIRLEK